MVCYTFAYFVPSFAAATHLPYAVAAVSFVQCRLQYTVGTLFPYRFDARSPVGLLPDLPFVPRAYGWTTYLILYPTIPGWFVIYYRVRRLLLVRLRVLVRFCRLFPSATFSTRFLFRWRSGYRSDLTYTPFCDSPVPSRPATCFIPGGLAGGASTLPLF